MKKYYTSRKKKVEKAKDREQKRAKGVVEDTSKDAPDASEDASRNDDPFV